METIRKTPESVETRFGEVLGARDNALGVVKDGSGFGPPDLCWVQKSVTKVFRKKQTEVRGYYHWVLGLDVASGASIETYFASLSAAVEKAGFLHGLVAPREYSIERGIYCCYDPFSCLDIWCDLQVPGEMVARGIDHKGYLCEVTPLLWYGAQVGSFLRSELYDATAMLSCSRVIRRADTFQTHEDESRFLDGVIMLYKEGLVQKNMDKLHWDKGGGVVAEDMDVVAATILHYFRKKRRWQKALQFFTRLQEYYPAAAAYLAAVYRELDNTDGAIALLEGAVEHSYEKVPLLLVALGAQLVTRGDARRAQELANKAIALNQMARPAWILLAGCLLKRQAFATVLKTLNLMPSPIMPPSGDNLLFKAPPPRPKSITRPSNQQYYPELAEVRKMSQETHLSCRQLRSLPGQVLAPREHGNAFPSPNGAPTRCTQVVVRECYGLLLDLVRALGWEDFISLRSDVFILPGEGFQRSNSGLYTRTSVSSVKQTPRQEHGRKVQVRLIVQPSNHADSSVENDTLEKGGGEERVMVVLEVVGSRRSIKHSSTATVIFRSSSADAVGWDLEDGRKLPSTKSSHVTFNETPKESNATPSNDVQVNDDGDVPDAPQERNPLPDFQGENAHARAKSEGDIMTNRQEEVKDELSEKGGEEMGEGTDNDAGAPQPVTPQKLDSKLHVNTEHTGEEQASQAGSVSPSTTIMSEAERERWLVKVVSKGIKDRVKYFESMAEQQDVREPDAPMSSARVDVDDAVTKMKPTSSRRGTSMTMMEFLTQGWQVDNGNEQPPPENSGPPPDGQNSARSSKNDTDVIPEEASSLGGTGSANASWLSVDWSSFKGKSLGEALSPITQNGDREPDGSSQRSSHRHLSPFEEEERTSTVSDVPEDGDDSVMGDGSCIESVLDGLEQSECSEWLDELILALWEDLAMYTELKRMDRKLKSKMSRTLAECILGTREENYISGSEEEEVESEKKRLIDLAMPRTTPGDWMQRGMLCERLQRIPEAEQAYRVCLFKSFNLSALLGLARIYAMWGWCKETMHLLSRVATYHDRCHDFDKDPYAPGSIVRTVSQLVACVGNMEVRSCSTNCHPMVRRAVEDVLKWHLRSGQERRGSICLAANHEVGKEGV